MSTAPKTARLILFILSWHLCLSDGFACTERRFMCQHLSGYGKCFEVYYRLPMRGFHFYCLEAGGGIIAPHCTGGSWGWRLAAAEGPIDYWPGVKFYPACFALLVPDPLLPREMGCHRFPPRKKACNLVFYSLVLFLFFFFFYIWLKKRKKRKHVNSSLLYFYFFYYSEACDYAEWAYLYFLWVPININRALWPLIYHSVNQ